MEVPNRKRKKKGEGSGVLKTLEPAPKKSVSAEEECRTRTYCGGPKEKYRL